MTGGQSREERQHGRYSIKTRSTARRRQNHSSPKASANGLATIKAGGNATLKVTLGAGKYVLFCAIDSHRQLGMQAKLTVG